MKLYVQGAGELGIPILSPIPFVDAGVLGIYYRYALGLWKHPEIRMPASLPPLLFLLSIPSHTSSLFPPSLACAPCIDSQINVPARTRHLFSCCFLHIARFSPSASFHWKNFSSAVLLELPLLLRASGFFLFFFVLFRG